MLRRSRTSWISPMSLWVAGSKTSEYSLALSGLIFEMLHNTDLRMIDELRIIREKLETIRDFLREERERLREQGIV